MKGFSIVPSPGYSLTATSLKGVERGCQGLRLVAGHSEDAHQLMHVIMLTSVWKTHNTIGETRSGYQP